MINIAPLPERSTDLDLGDYYFYTSVLKVAMYGSMIVDPFTAIFSWNLYKAMCLQYSQQPLQEGAKAKEESMAAESSPLWDPFNENPINSPEA